jgi:uncharacterized membrane protein YfcA
MEAAYVLLGLTVGILVGFMGIGGGVILVPALVYLLHFDQHVAQGTSLFLQLPPLGLGALLLYKQKGQADLKVGSICAAGFFLGGYFGSKIAVGLSSRMLGGLFGSFLIVVALLEWRREFLMHADSEAQEIAPRTSMLRYFLILLAASGVGVMGGLFGVGGGILLVPLLVFVFGFQQHRAQGTSLVALVPPSGLLAFINYAMAKQVAWIPGLLIMPGVFAGAMAGTRIALKLSPLWMRRVFTMLLFAIGIWEVFSSLRM